MISKDPSKPLEHPTILQWKSSYGIEPNTLYNLNWVEVPLSLSESLLFYFIIYSLSKALLILIYHCK